MRIAVGSMFITMLTEHEVVGTEWRVASGQGHRLILTLSEPCQRPRNFAPK